MSELVRDTRLSWRDYEYQANLRLNKLRYFQISVDPASIGATSSAETSVTIRGVAPGDIVIAAPPASLETGLALSGCRVSAADTVSLRLTNVTSGSVDGTARTWEFLVIALSSGQ